MIQIREAHFRDLPTLVQIYNDAILHTTATFDLEPKTIEERKSWFFRHSPSYPLYVAEVEENVVGYCGILPYSEKAAYAKTVELSIYLHPQAQGKGIGTRLLQVMIEKARSLGYHTILSGITDGNEASIKLHERFGFKKVSHFKEVGYKFGRWLDVCFYQLML